MAEETDAKDKGKEKEKAAAPPSKGLSKKVVIMIGAGALLLGLGSAIAFFKLSGNHKAEAKSDEAQAEASASTHGEAAAKVPDGKVASAQMYDLDSFIVNLADAPEVRYLKLTLKLELDRPDASTELASRLPQVRDAVLILLSSKDSASLRTTQGKFQLRDELTQRVNHVLPRSGVRTVYFTEFVVQ